MHAPCPDDDARLQQLCLSALSPEIERAVLPINFNLPKFTKYDPSADAYTHLIHCRQLTNLYANEDSIMCKVFPTRLGTLGSI